jgi:hypothetical protein
MWGQGNNKLLFAPFLLGHEKGGGDDDDDDDDGCQPFNYW